MQRRRKHLNSIMRRLHLPLLLTENDKRGSHRIRTAAAASGTPTEGTTNIDLEGRSECEKLTCSRALRFLKSQRPEEASEERDEGRKDRATERGGGGRIPVLSVSPPKVTPFHSGCPLARPKEIL